MDSQGLPLARGSVSAMDRSGNTTVGSGGGTIRPDGTFLIPPLPAGEYLLRASAPPPPPPPPTPGPQGQLDRNTALADVNLLSPPEVLMAAVSVNGVDISGVLLTPLKRLRISGRITFGPAASATLGATVRSSMVRLSLAPRSPEAATMGLVSPAPTSVREDFSLEFTAPAAEVVIRAIVSSPEWVVKSIRVGRIDITDSGVDLRAGHDVDDLEVELTSRPPEISGRVTDARGEPQSTPVLFFPQDRERWIFDSRLITTARADQVGQYKIRTLPPGRYLAVVLDPSQLASALQDPETLESLRPRATPVSLGEGEVKTLDLRVETGR